MGSEIKLTRSFRNALEFLEPQWPAWSPDTCIPDGNGHCSGGHHASGLKLRQMRDAGLIEFGREELGRYGYRITNAGRAALARSTQVEGEAGR